eukprot:4146173-Amphidinium_carterae.1
MPKRSYLTCFVHNFRATKVDSKAHKPPMPYGQQRASTHTHTQIAKRVKHAQDIAHDFIPGVLLRPEIEGRVGDRVARAARFPLRLPAHTRNSRSYASSSLEAIAPSD